jgi:hypothetical protein
VQLHAQTAPTRFQVMGERSSGTNLVKRLMIRNSGLTPSEVLGWKHGHPHALAIPADLAVICVVRNAADWALSMHAKPWHSTPQIQALDFADFIRAPWTSIIDRARYFEGSGEQGLVGQPLQLDRDPLTGAVYSTLFALRRAKLSGLLSHLNRGCTCVLLRAETVQTAQQASIDSLRAALGQPARSSAFRPVGKRLGSKFKPAIATRPDTPETLTPADHAFMIEQLDEQTEAALGYTYAPPTPHL